MKGKKDALTLLDASQIEFVETLLLRAQVRLALVEIWETEFAPEGSSSKGVLCKTARR
jgi:hypothetical protein